MQTSIKNKVWFIFALAMFVYFASYVGTKPTQAQDVQLKVATGGTAGTYHQMFTELNGKCSESLNLSEQISKGSIDNLSLILSNKVNAAIIQEDILFLKKRTETVLSSYRTLFVLHPEEVHLIALSAGKKIVTKSWGGLKSDESTQPALNSITDLDGKVIGSFGGSLITAQILQLQTGIKYTVQEVADADSGIAALNAGQIDALLAVGGSQLPWVEKLSRNFKLLEVPESVATRVKDVYQRRPISYPNLGASGIPTVATSAVFVTRQYKTPEYVQALFSLRTCFFRNLDYLKETTGFHAKWSDVKGLDEEGFKGTFVWYDLPGSTAKIQPASSKARK